MKTNMKAKEPKIEFKRSKVNSIQYIAYVTDEKGEKHRAAIIYLDFTRPKRVERLTKQLLGISRKRT